MADLVSGARARPLPKGIGRRLQDRVNRLEDEAFGWLLLTPSVLLLLVFLIGPILYALLMSFQRIELTKGPDRVFNYGANYVRMVEDQQFWATIPRTVYMAGLTVALSTLVALAIALLLNDSFKGKTLLQVAILVPWAVAPVANGIFWKFIFNGSFGILNAVLLRLGLITEYVIWLDDPFKALNVAVLGDVWKYVPFLALILLAALQGIPQALYRAARMDGASAVQAFIHVTLPILAKTILILVLIQTTWSLQVFDLIYVLTKGGPAQGTVVLNYLVFTQAFENLSLGYSAAIAMVLCALIVACSSLVFVLMLRERRARLNVPREDAL